VSAFRRVCACAFVCMTCVAQAFVCTVSCILYFFWYVRMNASVCNFSELVCDLLPRRLFDGFC